MAIYRFRVAFEDYEETYREIDMPSKATFLQLHEAIHKSTGYNSEHPSSFYVSNDQWKKGTEIAFLPSERKVDNGVLNVEDIKLSKFIDDPHQKFYYVYNFDRPVDFHVELMKILKEEEGKEYPSIFKVVGESPKMGPAANFPTAPLDLEEDDDDEEHVDDETIYGMDEEDADAFDMYDDEQTKEGDGSNESFGDY